MRNFLSNYFSLAHELIAKNRKLLFFAAGAFIAGLLIGMALFKIDVESAQKVAQVVLYKFEGMDETMSELGVAGRIWVLFWNNFRVVLVSFATGILLGIIPTGVLFFNGLFVGITFGMMAEQGVNIAKLFLIGILPHGVFEIPAFLLGGAMGIRLGFGVIFSPEGHTWSEGMLLLLKDMAVSLAIIVPCLALAATLEITVTPLLVEAVFGTGFLSK